MSTPLAPDSMMKRMTPVQALKRANEYNRKPKNGLQDVPADGKTSEKLVAEGLALSHGAETAVGNALGEELESEC